MSDEGKPRIGVDEWVASVAGRRGAGPLDAARAQLGRVPPAALLVALLLPAAFIPVMTSDQYMLQVAIDTAILMLLALGLNVAVGLAGILDLGYVAFFGFGAYLFAMFASGHTGLHWHAEFAIVAVVVGTALLGFLLGLPSRRLVGDYLAIVTLFFLQIFLTILINGDKIKLPFLNEYIEKLDGGLTRGPNGISNIDPMNWFGLKLTSLTQYFYFALIAVAVVIVALHLLNRSRTGRAWRALRDEPLAAEMMGMPVNWLKLVAFAVGASVAGLAGTLFAAEQGAVFPSSVDITRLITVYAAVILGGAGSLGGVAVGAIIINVSLELLRTPANASWLFYIGLALAIAVLARPWGWRAGAALVGGVIGVGFAVHAAVGALWEAGTAGTSAGEAWIDQAVESWVLLQANATPNLPTDVGKWGFALMIAAMLGLSLLQGWRRLVAAVPTLYLAACIWENVLVAQSAVTRYIILGAMLVSMMAARPQGLFGTPRVEIV